VRELQEIIQTLEPRLAATQSRLESTLDSAASKTQDLQPEIERLRMELVGVNEEIARLQREETHMKQAAVAPQPKRRHSGRRAHAKLPKAYTGALAAYKAGDYDNSILQFQEFAQKQPPNHLKDNISFWLGSNYFKLELYDDAIAQFQNVLDRYPKGNKVHDSRFMLGLTLLKKGDRGGALDTLEMALKNNPPPEIRDKIEKQLMGIK
ncbi:MAG: tol-pal system YbgF family protein, partial [Nitrospinaceae bacterium]